MCWHHRDSTPSSKYSDSVPFPGLHPVELAHSEVSDFVANPHLVVGTWSSARRLVVVADKGITTRIRSK